MSFKQFDVVKLVHGIPEDDIPPGTTAVIVEVYDEPEPHYEIEVTTDDDSLYTRGATDADLAPIDGGARTVTT